MKSFPLSFDEALPHVDAVVLPFFQEEGSHPVFASSLEGYETLCEPLIRNEDFTASFSEVVFLYTSDGKRLILLGLGDESALTLDRLREIFYVLTKEMTKKKYKKIFIATPEINQYGDEEFYRALLEGIAYGNYRFSWYRSTKESLLEECYVLTSNKDLFKEVEKTTSIVMNAVRFARDLANGNADDITPTGFAEAAQTLSGDKLSVHVHDEAWLEKERMNLVLTVGKGSAYAPRFVVIHWAGNVGAGNIGKGAKSSDHTVLIGKGITFDTGGLNLKPPDNMKIQKGDMAGAACVLAVMKILKETNSPCKVTALIPLCENSISGSSYKPGDVYISRSKKSVEITNTDAEGRLILADALDYAKEEIKPSRIIDVATLTGAAEVSLGTDISALFSNSDSLAYEIEEASKISGDPVWRMPLWQGYLKLLDSDIADIKNAGNRMGGAIQAALFLEQFVGSIPWVHMDIAGTDSLSEPRRYYGKGATGVMTRAIFTFFKGLSEKAHRE